MAYPFLQEAANKYTEHTVIETAVDSETTMKPKIPEELVILLQRRIDQEDGIERDDQVRANNPSFSAILIFYVELVWLFPCLDDCFRPFHQRSMF